MKMLNRNDLDCFWDNKRHYFTIFTETLPGIEKSLDVGDDIYLYASSLRHLTSYRSTETQSSDLHKAKNQNNMQ